MPAHTRFHSRGLFFPVPLGHIQIETASVCCMRTRNAHMCNNSNDSDQENTHVPISYFESSPLIFHPRRPQLMPAQFITPICVGVLTNVFMPKCIFTAAKTNALLIFHQKAMRILFHRIVFDSCSCEFCTQRAA
jgi:hypothetical protein